MAKTSIPNVLGGLLELPNGKVVQLESVEGFQWLASPDFRSFRFEDGLAPYTCRKEKVKDTDGYWYGYQRVGGKVTKRYIGKTSDLSQARLIEVSDRFHALPKNHLPLPKNNSATFSKLTSGSTTSMLPNPLGNKQDVSGLPNSSHEAYKGKTPTARLGAEIGELPDNSVDNLPGGVLCKLKREIAQLKAEKEQLEQELADCRQDLATKSQAIAPEPVQAEPAQVLNQLRKQNKRTKVTLRDVEDIIELISGD
jgi:hypothetical protein